MPQELMNHGRTDPGDQSKAHAVTKKKKKTRAKAVDSKARGRSNSKKKSASTSAVKTRGKKSARAATAGEKVPTEKKKVIEKKKVSPKKKTPPASKSSGIKKKKKTTSKSASSAKKVAGKKSVKAVVSGAEKKVASASKKKGETKKTSKKVAKGAAPQVSKAPKPLPRETSKKISKKISKKTNNTNTASKIAVPKSSAGSALAGKKAVSERKSASASTKVTKGAGKGAEAKGGNASRVSLSPATSATVRNKKKGGLKSVKKGSSKRSEPVKKKPMSAALRRALSGPKSGMLDGDAPAFSEAAPAVPVAPRKRKSPLTAKQLQKFRELLLARREKLIGSVQTLEDVALRGDGVGATHRAFHPDDQGAEAFDQDFKLRLAATEREMLEEIDEALRRVEEGRYGICEETGKPIGLVRLEAKPWARVCIEIALARDTRARFFSP